MICIIEYRMPNMFVRYCAMLCVFNRLLILRRTITKQTTCAQIVMIQLTG